MIACIRQAQCVLGMPEKGDAQSIYVGSSPEKANKAFKDLARSGVSEKFNHLVWYGNGRLIKSCKLKLKEKTPKEKSSKE